jgi:hypothetical protein
VLKPAAEQGLLLGTQRCHVQDVNPSVCVHEPSQTCISGDVADDTDTHAYSPQGSIVCVIVLNTAMLRKLLWCVQAWSDVEHSCPPLQE